jgi:hypothetical protein
METVVSYGDQGQDQDLPQFSGYGPHDNQGSPVGQGEHQNCDDDDDQVAS